MKWRAPSASAVCGNMEVLRTIRTSNALSAVHNAPIAHRGDIFTCAPLKMEAGNLLEIGDYFKAMEIGEQRHGPVPYCDARCPLVVTEGSTAISHPHEELPSLAFPGARRKQIELQRPQRLTPRRCRRRSMNCELCLRCRRTRFASAPRKECRTTGPRRTYQRRKDLMPPIQLTRQPVFATR